jgi:hypothetical protein
MKALKIIMLIVLPSLVFFNCTKTENKTDGLSQDIHNIVPDSILTKMKALGLPINEGTTPPNIEKIYLASPFVLKATNRPSDFVIGYQFSDYKVQFYQQNNSKLSILLDYINGPESGTGLGGFVSGANNKFSVFAKLSATSNGDKADLIQVISGTIVSGAIKDLYFANFMLNNYGNPHGYWIGQGQGRVIYDSDGNSPEQSTFKSLSIQNAKSSAAAK